MMGRNHLLLAGVGYAALATRPLETPLGTLVAPVLGGEPLPNQSVAIGLSLGIAAAAGLAPDLDKAGSTAARSLGVVTGALSWGIERSLGHRGGFHSLLGVGLGLLLGELLGARLGLTGLGALVAFGWAAHLLTDAVTVQGVPLFWPVTAARAKLPPGFTTGTWRERVVVAIALVGLALYAAGWQWPPGAR